MLIYERRTSPTLPSPPPGLRSDGTATFGLILQQYIPCSVDFCREIVGAAVIGMKLHHQAVVRRLDRRLVGAGREAEDGISLVDGDVVAAAARSLASLPGGEVIVPVGVDAVEIGLDQPCALFIGGASFAQQAEEVGAGHLPEPHPGKAAGEHGARHRAGIVIEAHAQIRRRYVRAASGMARAAKTAEQRPRPAQIGE